MVIQALGNRYCMAANLTLNLNLRYDGLRGFGRGREAGGGGETANK